MARDNWREVRLVDVAERVSVGLATSVTEAYADDGIPIIRNQNIKKGFFDGSDMLYLDRKFSALHPNKRVKAGDVITVHTGSKVGVTCVVPEEFDGAQTFTTLIVTPKQNVLSGDFLSLVLNSDFGAYQAVRLVVGGGKGNLNTKDFKRYPLLLPPYAEQLEIVKVFLNYDESISRVEGLVRNAQKQKKALMQQLLSGKKRLHGFSENWNKYELERAFRRVSEKNSKKNTNVLTISGKDGLVQQTDYFNKSVAAENLEGYFLVKRGQFAYNKSYSKGYPMGAIKRLNHYEYGVVTTLYICFEVVDKNKTNSDFFEHYFESGQLNRGLTRIANEGGRAHGLLNVKPADFFSLIVSIPNYEEQTKIAEILSLADQEIETFKEKLRYLKQEKKALMQQLLSGNVRVNVDETETA